MKKNISIEGLDPVKLYGAGDSILKEFCSYYPALKVVARGDEIILDGKRSNVLTVEIFRKVDYVRIMVAEHNDYYFFVLVAEVVDKFSQRLVGLID